MNAHLPNIVVVGSANTDLVVSAPAIPRPGETVLGQALQTVQGGKGANQAVAAARLGGAVTFVARVGDDAYGRASVDAYRRDNIETAYITVMPGVASGVALITINETTGENAITVAPGANALLSREDIERAAPAFLNADAIILSLEVPLEAIEAAAALAHTRRVPVILNPAPARALPPELLRRVFLLTPNETEAQTLLARTSPFRDDAELGELLDLGMDGAVVTLGAQGAVIVTPDGIERVSSYPVRAVDTVAAGDTFTSALAVEIARGRSLRDSVRWACAAAALKVTRRGAQPGIPTFDEVLAFSRNEQGAGKKVS